MIAGATGTVSVIARALSLVVALVKTIAVGDWRAKIFNKKSAVLLRPLLVASATATEPDLYCQYWSLVASGQWQ